MKVLDIDMACVGDGVPDAVGVRVPLGEADTSLVFDTDMDASRETLHVLLGVRGGVSSGVIVLVFGDSNEMLSDVVALPPHEAVPPDCDTVDDLSVRATVEVLSFVLLGVGARVDVRLGCALHEGEIDHSIEPEWRLLERVVLESAVGDTLRECWTLTEGVALSDLVDVFECDKVREWPEAVTHAERLRALTDGVLDCVAALLLDLVPIDVVDVAEVDAEAVTLRDIESDCPVDAVADSEAETGIDVVLVAVSDSDGDVDAVNDFDAVSDNWPVMEAVADAVDVGHPNVIVGVRTSEVVFEALDEDD